MNMIPVFLFALAMTITPGPNNMLLTVSGARFGFRQTLPLIGGITIGVVSQLILSAMGLSLLFELFPVLKIVLKISGTLYILYLAVKIGMAGVSRKEAVEQDRPLTVTQGLLFQYVNPKAYVMTITAMSVYTERSKAYLLSALTVIAVFALVAPLCISLWAGFGTVLNRTLMFGTRARSVQLCLAVVTALSAVFILI